MRSNIYIFLGLLLSVLLIWSASADEKQHETKANEVEAAASVDAEKQGGGGYGGGYGGGGYGGGHGGGYGGGYGGDYGGGHGGGRGGCKYGCCGGYGRRGCNNCCLTAEEAKTYMQNQGKVENKN